MPVALFLMHAITLRTVIPTQLEEPDACAHVSLFPGETEVVSSFLVQNLKAKVIIPPTEEEVALAKEGQLRELFR